MTAAEMQAIAPAPEGCEWVDWHGGAQLVRDGWIEVSIRPAVSVPPDDVDESIAELLIRRHPSRPGALSVEYTTPLDALLALRRLAGHLWPWPGWPEVPGVRPAGWGPAVRIREARSHPGGWLYRDRGRICVTYHPMTLDTGDCCAIDADGHHAEVDTRGQG